MRLLGNLWRDFKWWALDEFFRESYLHSAEHMLAAKILYDKKALLSLKQTPNDYIYNWNTESMAELMTRAGVWIDCMSRYESHGSVAALSSVPTYNTAINSRTLYEYVDINSIESMFEVYGQIQTFYRIYSRSSDPLIQKTLGKVKPIADEMFVVIMFCQTKSLQP